MTSDSSDGNNVFFFDLMRKKVTRISLTEWGRKGPVVGAGVLAMCCHRSISKVLWAWFCGPLGEI